MAGSSVCMRVQPALHVAQRETWGRRHVGDRLSEHGTCNRPFRPAARRPQMVTHKIHQFQTTKAASIRNFPRAGTAKSVVPIPLAASRELSLGKSESVFQKTQLRSGFLGAGLRSRNRGPSHESATRGVGFLRGGVPCCRLSDSLETHEGLESARGLGFGCAPLRGPQRRRDVVVKDSRKTGSGGAGSGAKAEGPVPPLHAVATLQDNSTRTEYLDSEIVDNTNWEEFLHTPLPTHPRLIRGQLDNGLRYVILPNALPPNRFEAHLEMHVGSVDELDHEQGVAHLIEHVTFLGSKKRERILGTGARSNAYTDFHHTVFHVHSPVKSQETGEALLPLVLDALHEIAFQPEFPDSRIEKERKAVLSELQMMNTIDYRVDCQLLQHLHSENKLGCRFPIGLEEQITKWDSATIQAFHKRWYFPGNATLFIVGDFGPVDHVLDLIHKQFSKVPPAVYYPNRNPATSPAAASLHTPNPETQNPKPSLFSGFSPSRSPSHTTSNSPNPETIKPSHAALQSLSSLFNSVGNHQPNPLSKKEVAPFPPLPEPIRKERHPIRPPVEHQWSSESMLKYAKSGYPAKRGLEVVPQVFQHELLQHFSMNVFSKNPVRPTRTYLDLRNVLMQRIVLSTFQFRINTRYKSANPPFSTIEMDHSDSGREGCSVTTLTIVSEAKDWRGAVQVAVQEVRRLKEFGVTQGELTRYLKALLKDSEQLAAMIDNIPSIDNLDFIMESDALGHSIMDQQQGHECLSAVADSVTLEDVNAVAVNLLEFVSDYGNSSAPVPAAVVCCVPKIISGDAGSPDEPFFITPEEIKDTIVSGLAEPIEGEPDLDVPKSLIPIDELEEKIRTRQPAFVKLEGAEKEGLTAYRTYDEGTGVVQRRLSNGIRINYKMTQNEARGGVMRLVAPGGRARETQNASAAVAIGTRTLSEAGSVGKWSREQVELFCVGNLINCILETDEEFICLDFHFVMRDNGMEAAFQLMHMVLEEPVWRDDALDRAKQMYLSYYRSMPKSLERATAHTLMKSMFKGDARFMEPTPDAIAKLDLETVSKAVFDQLKTGDMEVSVVGDFTEEELERCLLTYLGTLPAKPATTPEELKTLEVPFQVVTSFDASRRNQKVLLKDTDERACAFIAGAAPNRWGYTADGADLNTINQPCPPGLSVQQIHAMATFGSRVMVDDEGSLYWQRKRHPLYASVALAILAEIINSRLFTTVRDALGLTYDVSFELSLFDRLKTGWFVISVTSTPGKIEEAVNASLSVLKGLNDDRISDRELARAKRTLLTRHESDLKDNAYWLSLMTHVQTPSVHRKDVGCIRDLIYLYESCTTEDVYNAYDFLALEDENLYTCKGIAGPPELLQKHADVEAMVIEVEGESDSEDGQTDALLLGASSGRGRSTVTRPTT